MKTKRDWERIIRRMEQLLRLRSFPVAFKLLEDEEELNRIPYMRRLKHKVTLCQLITLVRNFDWTVGATQDDFISETCGSILGFCDIPEINKDGTFRSIIWVQKKEDGKRYEDSIPRIPLGRYRAVALAPLVYNPFDPDIVLIYGNPAQIMLIMNALQFEKYEVIHSYFVGETSCADVIARCYLDHKPYFTIPCYGERRYGHAQDDELVIGIPEDMMEKALRGLEALYRRGVRYPISYAGAEMDLSDAFPEVYKRVREEVRAIRGDGRDNRLVVGITGGIATGKSTVSEMLKELGSPLIDFDELARRVVEPGKPAWKQIVEYFGRDVLLEDNTLNRKKLSEIVFSDLEKKKMLERFVHPRIYKEFIKEIERIVKEDPDAIIQVAVPLLIELNQQYRFHKIVVVYASRETQIKRLMKRDNISREQAENILKSQLPIEEKVGFADFVINNEGSLEETRRQVVELWEKLKEIQRQMKESKRQKN